VDPLVDVNIRNSKNEIPLDVASANGNREVTKFLANHMGVVDPLAGMDVTPLDKPSPNLVPNDSFPPIGIAKLRNSPNELQKRSLHDASAEGNFGIVQSSLDDGADVNQGNAIHRTALYVASENKQLAVARLLINHGADVNCRDKTGWTPLHLVSRSGHPEIAELLLDHDADVDPKHEGLWTPLHLASWNSNLEVVKLLLERGADIHAQNIDGRTPYVLASQTGNRDILRLLSCNDGKIPRALSTIGKDSNMFSHRFLPLSSPGSLNLSFFPDKLIQDSGDKEERGN
jgi:ankyrin repeat protein